MERSSGENRVLRVGAPSTVPDPFPAWEGAGAPDVPVSVVIEVEGLPNLVHEVGHLLARRVLDHDHGIDYHAIPYDLGSEPGRAVLWEEMACCALSCGYGPDPGTPRDPAWVDAWFAEQVEIQPVFYGLEADVRGFWNRVAALYEIHAEAAESAVDSAFARTAGLLAWCGAPPAVVRPDERLSFGTLLRRARRRDRS